jgi:hypothetical protein
MTPTLLTGLSGCAARKLSSAGGRSLWNERSKWNGRGDVRDTRIVLPQARANDPGAAQVHFRLPRPAFPGQEMLFHTSTPAVIRGLVQSSDLSKLRTAVKVQRGRERSARK